MKLAMSTEQVELAESVRRFLTDRSPLTRVRELMDSVQDSTDPQVWQAAGRQLGLQGIAIGRSTAAPGSASPSRRSCWRN